MRTSIILTAALLAAASAADAREVSAARAREIAASVIPSVTDIPAHRRVPGLKDSDPAPYYLFNGNDNVGYVIVAGDDRLPAVLGYSRDGHLNPDDLPDALQLLLDMSVASLGSGTEAAAGITAGTPVVEPLLGDINWGQGEPFNTLCPMISGKHAYVGCVATAMAQIMRYYGFPAKGTGTHSYLHAGTTLSADFGATTYDWSNMPRVIPDNPSQAQVTAYSTLCYHLGVATNMTYASGGSGAYTMDVPGALRDHFGYTASLRMHLRSYYNTDEWMSLIRSELDAGRPVYYSASSEDGQGGHAFVCDGYDSEGYVHMNWGWYGSANGYFHINHLNPDELGTGGGGGAYNVSQEILTHFMPAIAGDSPSPAIYGETRFSCDAFSSGITMMCYLGNLDTDPFDGEILAVITNPGGEILHTLKAEKVNVDPFKAGKSGSLLLTMRDIPNNTGNLLPDGNYRLKLAYRIDGMDAPELLRHPVGLPAYRDCSIINGSILLTDKHEPAPDVTMLTPLAPDGELYTDGSARFTVNLRNNSADFRLSTAVLTLVNVDDPAKTCSKEYSVNIYDLSESELTMAMDLPETLPPGTYRVTLAHKGHLDKPFATHDGKETIVKLSPSVANPVIRFITAPVWQNGTSAGNSTFARGDIIYIAAQAKNYAMPGETMVICRLVSNSGKSTVLRADAHSWTKGEQRTIAISNNVTADPGTYTLSFSYLDADGVEKPIGTGDNPVDIEIVESPYTPFEVTEFDMPSAIKKTDRVNCSITLRGLESMRGNLYIRVRQFTNTKGEIVYMKSGLNIVAGQEQTLTFPYRPGVDDGRYMTIVEFKELGSNTTLPAAGHDVYYKEINIGETSGIDTVVIGEDLPAMWYNLHGISISQPSQPGIYIRRQGSRSQKILIK